MPTTADVIIIGGGIIGCAIAESLAARGASVRLFERGLLGREASWAAAGMLAPQSEMPEPGAYLDFCLASRRLYPEVIDRIREESAIDPQYRSEGLFYVAFNEEEEQTLRARAAWQERLGLRVSILSRDDVLKAEPSLIPEFRMAVHFKEDHQLDPRLMTRGYAIAARRHGAQLLEYSPIVSILTQRDRAVGVELPREKVFAPWIILAAGCWSGLIPGLSHSIPTYPVKGQVLLLQAASPLFQHTLHSENIYLAPRFDGRVIVGATEEHDAGFDKAVEAGAMSRLLARAFDLVPALRQTQLADSWAGLRPGTPDRRAIIGESGIEGLILATGHFRNGILLAPITAKRICDFIFSEKWSEDIDPFALSRFLSESKAGVRENRFIES